jgi:hypothetical protein
MHIRNFELYRDGGTIEIETDLGIFCFDGRLSSTTKGKLFSGYPLPDNSNLVENSLALETAILEALKVYKNEFYQTAIDYFILTRQK